MKLLLLSCIAMIGFCNRTPTDYSRDCSVKIYGWKPVFEASANYKTISATTPQSTINAGKIYVYNKYILQVETGEGIHIIDNTNPDNPVKKGFIKSKCAAEVEMKDGYIYTNNFNDLVTLQYNFSTNTVQEVGRVANTFQRLEDNYTLIQPPGSGNYLCNYPKDSVVKSWSKDSINACYSCYKN